MYFGKTPFCDNSEYLTFQRIKKNSYVLPEVFYHLFFS